jgi:tetratricopeptide (TPR) repeat protein
VLACLLAGVAPGLAAQDDDPRLRGADSLAARGNLEGAMAELDGLLAGSGDSYPALWRCASVAVGLGVVAEAASPAADDSGWYERAERCAEAAMGIQPEGVEGRYWAVAVLGRKALSAGRREAGGLADRIREGALGVLEDDPDHAGAHNALGRLHFEVMALSGVTRFLGRTFLRGRALAEASWEEAEHHLRRAVELEPRMALYRLDLGRYLAHVGREEDARREFRAAANGTPLNPADRVFREEAAELLRRVER